MNEQPIDAARRAAMERLGYPETPELVQRLAAVTARGNSVAVLAGDGSGKELLYGLAAAERCDGESPDLQALALTSTPEGACRIARVFHVMAAPEGLEALAWLPWRESEEEGSEPPFAQLLAGRPRELLPQVRAGRLGLADLRLLVIDDLEALERSGDWELAESILDTLPPEAQKIVVTTERSATLDRLLRQRLGRARRWPSALLTDAGEPPEPDDDAPVLWFAAAAGEEARLDRLSEGLREAARRTGEESAAVHCPGEGPAHRVAASLAARGFALTADPEEPGLVVSWGKEPPPRGVAALWGLPSSLEELEERLDLATERFVTILPSEIPQLRILARRARWRLRAVPERLSADERDEIESLRRRIRRRIEEWRDAPELLLLEPLLDEYGAARVAAAASALLREGGGGTGAAPGPAATGDGHRDAAESAGRTANRTDRAGKIERARSGGWVRLYVSAGERDEVGPSDLVGAITGETSLVGGQIGKIEVRRSYSLVDVEAAAAAEVIEKLSGAEIKGRQVVARPDREG